MHILLSKTFLYRQRTLLLISAFALGSHFVVGQTYLGNVEFTSQNALNSWSSSWKSVSGNVYITSLVDNVITSLSPLQNLESVTGSVIISENHSLTTLAGLDKLKTVGGLEISFNSTLTNINAIQMLTTVNGSVNILGNQNLTTLNALNNALSITGDLTIKNNPKLSQCNVNAICEFLNNHSSFTYLNVSNNAGSCFNEASLNTGCNGALPVVLANFEVIVEGATALLRWATSQETNIRDFEIESSNDGTQWHCDGTVKANGESTALLQYMFIDSSPGEGNHYYRLKMNDLDGSFAYSRVRSIHLGKSGISLYPNPVADRLYIRGAGTFNLLQVFDSQGRSVLTMRENPARGIPVATWKKGFYMIKIVGQKGSSKNFRIIKN
ncbi:T9SS type A sorting domain-containing protein [Dyadobacter pollutisoli]|uniref:T9SS type A sorting domain-containing protein n=1 Tax=Dyadobacter pollutisoli TaxID=2910158 RepID=A0A9E8NBB8_9BACT|nr:T9SS type A sorting domain-containing protein [Dyadobacter pollutisoli]WAC12818.1 T9SS type A sorting domain-containing protein [Dyadobacter pollutisoli]